MPAAPCAGAAEAAARVGWRGGGGGIDDDVDEDVDDAPMPAAAARDATSWALTSLARREQTRHW